jgi:hypothetical protein
LPTAVAGADEAASGWATVVSEPLAHQVGGRRSRSRRWRAMRQCWGVSTTGKVTKGGSMSRSLGGVGGVRGNCDPACGFNPGRACARFGCSCSCQRRFSRLRRNAACTIVLGGRGQAVPRFRSSLSPTCACRADSQKDVARKPGEWTATLSGAKLANL